MIVRANTYLHQFQLKTANGCINHLIDEKGNHFYIPNYCINDPYFEKELPFIDEKIEQRSLNVLYYTNYLYKDSGIRIIRE